MVPLHRILHRPRHLGSSVALPVWAYHGDRNLRPRRCHKRASLLYFPNFKQNQRMTYREVLIAGDLSQDDVDRATAQLGAFEVSLQQMNLSQSVLTGTVSRTLLKHGPCSRTAEARQTLSSSLTATKPFTSPNRVCPNSSLAVLGLGLSIPTNLRRST